MYEPEVDDYVIWDQGVNGIDEGWVYFKCDTESHNLRGDTHPRYITIETSVKPKPKCRYTKNEQHKMIHTLLLCYENDWKNLKCTKKRTKEDRLGTVE